MFFLRNVKSAGFFEQMKGRGVRVISPDKLRTVTPSAKVKDRFIIVDAVGVCEQDKTDSHTLNRQPSKTLEQVLEYVAQGGTDPEALTTRAGRIARLQREYRSGVNFRGWKVMSRLSGKTAVVTGASKGIGAGIAKGLAAEG